MSTRCQKRDETSTGIEQSVVRVEGWEHNGDGLRLCVSRRGKAGFRGTGALGTGSRRGGGGGFGALGALAGATADGNVPKGAAFGPVAAAALAEVARLRDVVVVVVAELGVGGVASGAPQVLLWLWEPSHRRLKCRRRRRILHYSEEEQEQQAVSPHKSREILMQSGLCDAQESTRRGLAV